MESKKIKKSFGEERFCSIERCKGKDEEYVEAGKRKIVYRSIETSLILRCLYSEFPHSQKGSELLLAIVRDWLKSISICYCCIAEPRVRL
jgi:hypothetical protein